MAPDMLLGLDKARKEELHNDMVDAIRGRFFGTPSPLFFIGADFSKSKSLSALMLVEMKSGKVIHCSKDAIISINDNMKMTVGKNDFGSIPPVLEAKWNAKLQMTHKQVRQFRKFRREAGLHKPRLPRKLKKKFKPKIKLMRYERNQI